MHTQDEKQYELFEFKKHCQRKYNQDNYTNY